MNKLVRLAALSALPLLAACATVGTFDRSAADRLQTISAESDEFISALLTSPTDISLQSGYGALPAPLANFMTVIAPQQASSCFVDGNSSADDDEDGVPANASFTVDCTFEDGSTTVTLDGSMAVQDDDDSDPLSGYDVTIDNFGFSILNNDNGNEIVRSFDLAFDLDKATGPNPGYSASIQSDYNRTGPIIGAANLTVNSEQTYSPDDGADPFAGGTFTLDDTLTFVHDFTVYTLDRTSVDLHFDAACATSNKFDSGSVAHEDSLGNSLLIEYTACGTATGTFSSGPAQAGF